MYPGAASLSFFQNWTWTCSMERDISVEPEFFLVRHNLKYGTGSDILEIVL